MGFKKREKGLREIGAALGAGTIVDGSVRRAGDRVRIVAKLIDASDRRAPLGRDLRPRLDGYLHDPDGRGAEDRRRAAGRAVAQRAGADRASPHGRSRSVSALSPGATVLHEVHPGRVPPRASPSSSRRSRRTRGSRWRIPRWRTPTPRSASRGSSVGSPSWSTGGPRTRSPRPWRSTTGSGKRTASPDCFASCATSTGPAPKRSSASPWISARERRRPRPLRLAVLLARPLRRGAWRPCGAPASWTRSPIAPMSPPS